jgi:L-lysine exporter family protein LysE/ArgO
MPLLQGILLGAGLCGSLGPQSLYVLRQGIRGDAVFAVAMICTLADFLLIGGAIAGAGALNLINPLTSGIATWGSACVVLAYGYFSFWAATQHRQALPTFPVHAAFLLGPTSAALALSLLNPQVYVEMLLLVGGVALEIRPSDRPMFGLGVALVSPLWFFGLAFAGRRCAVLFNRPVAREALDIATGILMIALALLIIRGELS